MKLKKLTSTTLAFGLIFNTSFTSFASIVLGDDRYETFKGSNIVINNVLEKDEIDVEIEGNTLVNLIDYNKIDTRFYNYNSGYISQKKWDDRIWGDIEEVSSLKPNTSYTLVVEDIHTTEDVHIGYNRYFKMAIDDKITVFRTPDIIDYGFVFKVHGAKSNVKIMLLEGDYRNKEIPSYFEGVKSVGELDSIGNNVLKIKSQNKNLLNLLDLKMGKKTFAEVENLTSNSLKLIILPENTKKFSSVFFDEMKFIPGTTYRVKGRCVIKKGNGIRPFFSIRKGNPNKLLKDIYPNENGIINTTFTPTESVHRIEFFSGNQENCMGDIEILFEDFQITIDDDSDFTKPLWQEKEIVLKEPLRSLPNGIKDKVIKKNGQWVVERNCAETILTEESIARIGSSHGDVNVERIELDINFFKNIKVGDWLHTIPPEAIFEVIPWKSYLDSRDNEWTWFHSTYKTFHIVCPKGTTLDEVKSKLLNTKVVYQLETPIYEPLNISSTLNLYEGITCISNDSGIPANMNIVVDRVANRAKEYSEIAKANPTIENISLARMWVNLMRESVLKDEFQDNIDGIVKVNDMTLDRKMVSANLDLYIQCENILQITLNTNLITFEDFSGIEDMTKENAINISINSSLPYSLNAYLSTEIQNSDKSLTMNKDILNIKENSESIYQTFSNTTDKVVLKDNCNAGNDLMHGVDIKLKGGLAFEKDIYKTTIKFEAKQK